MKIKIITAMISLAILSACTIEENEESKTEQEPSIVSPYDLSKISVKCYENHNEDRNDTGAGSDIPSYSTRYIYTSSNIHQSNQCSPSGSDIPLFIVNDNLISVLNYQQDIDGIRYEYSYISLDSKSAKGIDILDSAWPKYITARGTNGKGDYEIKVDLVKKTKTFIQDSNEETESNYTSQVHDDFPMMLQQQTAMQLFKLANGQEPSL